MRAGAAGQGAEAAAALARGAVVPVATSGAPVPPFRAPFCTSRTEVDPSGAIACADVVVGEDEVVAGGAVDEVVGAAESCCAPHAASTRARAIAAPNGRTRTAHVGSP